MLLKSSEFSKTLNIMKTNFKAALFKMYCAGKNSYHSKRLNFCVKNLKQIKINQSLKSLHNYKNLTQQSLTN